MARKSPILPKIGCFVLENKIERNPFRFRSIVIRMIDAYSAPSNRPWQFLYFLPLPQGALRQLSFPREWTARFSKENVHESPEKHFRGHFLY